MKTIKIETILEKVTKRAITNAIETEERLDFGEVAKDFDSVLIMTTRSIDWYDPKNTNDGYLFTKNEKINFIYKNIERLIKESANQFNSVARYFGLKTQ